MIKNIASKNESQESKIYSYFTEKKMHDNKNIYLFTWLILHDTPFFSTTMPSKYNSRLDIKLGNWENLKCSTRNKLGDYLMDKKIQEMRMKQLFDEQL